jgi:homoaconitase/3-isopropylmalate dehydratase large subunit
MKKFILMLLALMMAATTLTVFAEDEAVIPSPEAEELVLLDGFVMEVLDESILLLTRDGLYVEALLTPETILEGKDIAIDQIVIGSCTNGQLPDMAAAAAVLKGKHLAPGVRGIIIPATQSVYRECMHLGYTDIFLDAGCIVSTPTCGPCLGGHMGILAAGERCVSSTNRNFVGRMGHVDSEVYLASPAVAAASGIAGHIAHPEEVMK